MRCAIRREDARDDGGNFLTQPADSTKALQLTSRGLATERPKEMAPEARAVALRRPSLHSSTRAGWRSRQVGSGGGGLDDSVIRHDVPATTAGDALSFALPDSPLCQISTDDGIPTHHPTVLTPTSNFTIDRNAG